MHRYSLVLLTLFVSALVCPLGSSASPSAPALRTTPARQPPWVDPTAYWSSPGANWIAWQLNQVNPRWGVYAAVFDQFERSWCFSQSPQELAYTVNGLLYQTIPGADIRTLPALGQMLQMIEQSCIAQGGDPGTVNYWIQTTANYMMTVVSANTQQEIRTNNTAWTRPAPALPKKAKSSLSKTVINGACSAVVDIGGDAILSKYTQLSGLRAIGLFGAAKVGCNSLVTKVWKLIHH